MRKMQFTSMLLIYTTTSLVTGNAVSPIRSTSNWLLLNTSGSKTTHLKMNLDETRLLGIINKDNIKNQRKDVAVDNDDNESSDRESVNFDENIIDQKDTHDNKGVRKQQWHNYPRRLDRLERYKREYVAVNSFNLGESTQSNEIHVNDDGEKDYADSNDQGKLDLADINNDIIPIMILKIRLYFLSNRLQYRTENGDKNKKFNKAFTEEKVHHFRFDNHDKTSNDVLQRYLGMGSLDEISPFVDEPEIKTIYVTRGRLPKTQSIYQQYPRHHASRQTKTNIEKKNGADNPEEIPVSKRIFSFWTRLHGLSQSDKALEHRRHFHAYGSYPTFDSNGDIVSAETRASLIRPAGSPLRWG